MKNIYSALKKTSIAAALALGIVQAQAQTTLLDFETFTLSPNSAYNPTTNVAFQTPVASFQYQYSTGYWLGGFAYTNITDSSTAGSNNLYGVRAYKGYTNSAIYVVGQAGGVVNLTVPQSTVNGFYVTNTTYAYKSIKSGDQFSRKFGDTTGTGSGTTIPQGSYPDYFKLIVKGYKNGVLKPDSATMILADYTYTNNTLDYVVNSWQFVNTSNLGEIDSLKFFMRSTDSGIYGMNTPGFFAIDNLLISAPVATGIEAISVFKNLEVYPNPFSSVLTIKMSPELKTSARVFDLTGKSVWSQELTESKSTLELNGLERGIYFLELTSGSQKAITKIIKN